MAMKASPEAIRDVISVLRETISDIDHIANTIRSGLQDGWNDSKNAEFNSVMNQIASTVESPKSDLEEAIPKLESLANSVEAYMSSSMG